MAGALSGFFGGIGSAVGAFFGAQGSEDLAQGDFQAAKLYADAADIAKQNVQIAKESTIIQEAQLQRQITKTIGAEQAAIAGNNLQGGSAGDLIRSSMQQGALARAVLSQQGFLEQQQFKQQALGLEAQEAAAVAAGNAALQSAAAQRWGGIFSLIGGVVGLFGL